MKLKYSWGFKRGTSIAHDVTTVLVPDASAAARRWARTLSCGLLCRGAPLTNRQLARLVRTRALQGADVRLRERTKLKAVDMPLKRQTGQPVLYADLPGLTDIIGAVARVWAPREQPGEAEQDHAQLGSRSSTGPEEGKAKCAAAGIGWRARLKGALRGGRRGGVQLSGREAGAAEAHTGGADGAQDGARQWAAPGKPKSGEDAAVEAAADPEVRAEGSPCLLVLVPAGKTREVRALLPVGHLVGRCPCPAGPRRRRAHGRQAHLCKPGESAAGHLCTKTFVSTHAACSAARAHALLCKACKGRSLSNWHILLPTPLFQAHTLYLERLPDHQPAPPSGAHGSKAQPCTADPPQQHVEELGASGGAGPAGKGGEGDDGPGLNASSSSGRTRSGGEGSGGADNAEASVELSLGMFSAVREVVAAMEKWQVGALGAAG
jgi:hypothetical protein